MPIIACAIQRPSSKFVPKSIIGTISNANKNLRYPAPVFKTYPQKYCWYHPHMPMIAYAIQRPYTKFAPKSIIGPISKYQKPTARLSDDVFDQRLNLAVPPDQMSNMRCGNPISG